MYRQRIRQQILYGQFGEYMQIAEEVVALRQKLGLAVPTLWARVSVRNGQATFFTPRDSPHFARRGGHVRTSSPCGRSNAGYGEHGPGCGKRLGVRFAARPGPLGTYGEVTLGLRCSRHVRRWRNDLQHDATLELSAGARSGS